jgi:phage terminase large subunit
MAEVVIPYTPRPLQLQIHDNLKRYNVLVCHRRFGKTVLSINQLIKSLAECELTNPRFAYIAPFYNQAKSVAWDYLKHYTDPIPGVKNYENELRVDIGNGGRLSLYGADNPDRLRGLYFDGVILDEYADMSPRVWGEIIRPALSDRKGWVLFIGTPKGRNQFWDIYNAAKSDPEWYAAMFKASETELIAPEELSAARKTMTPEQYEQEFECSFTAALLGAYYGKEMAGADAEKRIGHVPYDPALRVYTAWDLGMDDATAIWFIQICGHEIRFIDYYENTGCGLDHYVKELDRKPYTYAEHFLPHDTKVREIGTGKSRVETLESLGLDVTIVEQQRVEDGINAVRLMLARSWFDDKKCERGIEALRQYQRDWNDLLKTFHNKPRHDWASHAADAARYFALSIEGLSYKDKPRRPREGRSWQSL